MSTGFWMAFGLGMASGMLLSLTLAGFAMRVRRAARGFKRRL